MTKAFNNTGLYQKRRMWILIGMLMLVVIIPTICLLWFVSEAVRNERMAVRQELTEWYQSQLENLPSMLQNFWEQKIDKLSAVDPSLIPTERFNKIIESGLADSIILYDDNGELLYPCEVEPPDIDLTDFNKEWDRAEHLEFRNNDNLKASELYADIAGKAKNINLKARALQRQIRCLIKAGKKDDAMNIVTGVLSKPEYYGARDDNGRLIVPDSKLFVIQSMKVSPNIFQGMLENLVARVKDYGPPVMPSSQRMFLMKALKKIESSVEFPTFKAEELASSNSSHILKPGQYNLANTSGNDLWQVVTSDRTPVAQIKLPILDDGKLVASSQLYLLQSGQYGLTKVSEEKDLWQIMSVDRSSVALFTLDRIEKETQEFIKSNVSHTNAKFLFVPKYASRDSRPILRIAAGDYFPDWELIVLVEDDDLFMAASEKQVSLYIWTALLIIVGIMILAAITTRLFVRQMSLARMKNDLITTVSHELKTPLASIRLLVDTLMDGSRYKDEKLVKEYIELISKENERLTRLVENFLTFSRIEDKRQNFNFKVVAPEKIVGSVYDTIKHRFESGGFSFELKVAEGIPDIVADYDAMVMVLLNLLDNACHYSDKVKSVTLAAYSENGKVCFEVADKGIGMSSDQRKKILEPFYQVDQTMSRRGSGFGLGLSIVKSIVDVHHGLMEIESEPGKGSVFTIKVPVV